MTDLRADQKMIPILDPDSIANWFLQYGNTDVSYLKGHFSRFEKTKHFAYPPSMAMKKENILDVGAHWLHHAFFYANEGHNLFCVDAPATLTAASVTRAAEAMNAKLFISRYLELGHGIKDIGDACIDTVFFCEIIEHLTFNPILMWKEIYRVLKPGGRVILTTPNANFWLTRQHNIQRLIDGAGWGVKVADIFNTGTFGHHWKEYTPNELIEYFAALSPDFHITRTWLTDVNGERSPPSSDRLSFQLDESAKFDNIFMEITVREKHAGIHINPPWVPIYL